MPDALSRATIDGEVATVHDSNVDPGVQRVEGNGELSRPDSNRKTVDGVQWRRIRGPYDHLTGEEWKRVVPKDQRLTTLVLCHDDPRAGHMGVKRTLNRLRQQYYWPGMRRDVNEYVKRSQICQSIKVERIPKAGAMVTRAGQATRPWETICVDLVGPLPRSSRGFKHVLTVVDSATKFVIVSPMREATASEVCRLVEEQVFLMFGAPAKLICDNGVQFKSKQFERLAHEYGVELCYTAFYHPQANPAERVNQELKRMLRTYTGDNHRKWDANLAKIGCALRTYMHEGMGVTPYFVNFCRNIVTCGQNHKAIQGETTLDDPVRRATELDKLREDIARRLARKGRERVNRCPSRMVKAFCVGDRVWRKNYVQSDSAKFFSAKLAPEYVGPFRVVSKFSLATYGLEDNMGKPAGVWNVKDLKPYID